MNKRLFIIIFTIGIFLTAYWRFNNVLANPPSLFSDEVEAGYQAFVLNSCGTDYHGNPWPTHFQSLADWKSPLNIYSIALAQRFVNNPDLAVRLPAIIFGSLVPILLALVMQQTFKKPWLTLTTLYIAAINPWLIHYSRAGWEVNGMLFSFLGWLLFWLRYLSDHKFKNLVISIFFLTSTYYFYSTAKLLIPLLIFPVIFIWKKQLSQISRQHLIIAGILFIFLSIPMIRDTINGRSGMRFSYINIFTDPTNTQQVDQNRYQDSLLTNPNQEVGYQPSSISKLVHNKFTLIGSKFIRNYFKSWSTDFLFLQGDLQLRHGLGEKGNFYYPDLIFILIGLSFILHHKKIKKFFPKNSFKLTYFMFWLLVLSPVPFALTRDSITPHSTRLIIMAIPFLFFITLGIYFTYHYLLRFNQLKYILFILLLSIYSVLFCDFHHYYYNHYPQISARNWHYGLKQVVNFSYQLKDQYQKIYYSNSAEPVLPFFLYYTSYLPGNNSCPPINQIQEFDTTYFTGHQIEDTYYVGHIEWNDLLDQPARYQNNLFVANQADLDKITFKTHANLKMINLYELDQKYTEQEKLYVIKFVTGEI